MEGDSTYRKIIHVDMDAFYASVEQRDDPTIRGKPVAVGGSRKRGVVAAASYEARTFGVRSAMPSSRAFTLCPDIIFVKPNFEKYRRISLQIREIFYQYTDLVEPLSLDEAFLDVTHNKQGITSATRIAQLIRKEIWEETHLTASAGISINKFLAKVATDIHKPNGITLIPPQQVDTFLEKLPIEKFHGIGKKTSEKMKRIGIRCGKDLKDRSELELAQKFGKMGRYYFQIVRAKDDRPVKPNRERKSIGAENTFSEDLRTADDMLEKILPLIDKVIERLNQHGGRAKTVTLKIKYDDFVQTTRSRTAALGMEAVEEVREIVSELLYTPHLPEKPVRLLGVSLSNLEKPPGLEPLAGTQLTLEF